MAVTTEWTVPQTNRTVSSGLAADTKPADPVSGSTFYETDTDKIFTYDGVDWVQTGTNLANHVYLNSLIAGEDQTNDVLKVEQQFGYEVVDHGALAADEVLGATGAAGDFLARVTVTEAPTSQTIDIYDGTVAGGTLILSVPTTAAIGDTWEVGIVASNAGFTVDDKSDTTGIVVCVGRFT